MELQRVYVVRGKANSGKTSSLKELIELLKLASEELIPIQVVDGDDRIAVFKINGLVVGITTQGDNESQVKSGLDVIDGQCNIIFCATRTRGATRDYVIERFGNKITWIEALGIKNQKAYEYDNSSVFDKRNNFVAEILFNLIPA